MRMRKGVTSGGGENMDSAVCPLSVALQCSREIKNILILVGADPLDPLSWYLRGVSVFTIMIF